MQEIVFQSSENQKIYKTLDAVKTLNQTLVIDRPYIVTWYFVERASYIKLYVCTFKQTVKTYSE